MVVVAAIGVFDGVHRGHRVLLERARQLASGWSATPAVVTFDPPPVALFAPTDEPFQITPREDKVALLMVQETGSEKDRTLHRRCRRRDFEGRGKASARGTTRRDGRGPWAFFSQSMISIC